MGASCTYSKVGAGGWALQQSVTGTFPFMRLGVAVSIAGDWIAASAPGDGPGAVHLFQLGGAAWNLKQRISPSSLTQSSPGDGYGVVMAHGRFPLSLDFGRLVCGAPFTNGGIANGIGAAHILETDYVASAYDLFLDTRELLPGKQYTLCTDLDGFHQSLRFGDTEFQVTVNA